MVTCETLMPRWARSALMARRHTRGVQLSDGVPRLLLRRVGTNFRKRPVWGAR
jgi:hypothetical protein